MCISGLGSSSLVGSSITVENTFASVFESTPVHGDETPPIRRLLHDTGKSLFVGDCVVGPRTRTACQARSSVERVSNTSRLIIVWLEVLRRPRLPCPLRISPHWRRVIHARC